jgi:hypothetical protein
MQALAEIKSNLSTFANEPERFCNFFHGTFVPGAASFGALSRI